MLRMRGYAYLVSRPQDGLATLIVIDNTLAPVRPGMAGQSVWRQNGWRYWVCWQNWRQRCVGIY